MVQRSPFDQIFGQDRVRAYLSTAVRSGVVSHAYLFLGKPGSGKVAAAYAFSASLLCPKGGCGACETCVSVARRAHPDVHFLSPEGASGYVVDQIRELLHDVSLAPIRANRKIYIIDRADLLNPSSANAFLKTLEEPPAGVIFILLGRSRAAMLPTILSRCNVLPFRTIPLDEAVHILQTETGASADDAAIALAASCASLPRARDFLLSSSRKLARKRTLEVLDRLPDADDFDVLSSAKELLELQRRQLGDVRTVQEKSLAESSDYLSKGALHALEVRQKRELSASERTCLKEFSGLVQSWLRDCLLLLASRDDLLVNTDDLPSIERMSGRTTPASLSRAIRAVDETMAPISYNVSPQLCIENMLFAIREVLSCTKQ